MMKIVVITSVRDTRALLLFIVISDYEYIKYINTYT